MWLASCRSSPHLARLRGLRARGLLPWRSRPGDAPLAVGAYIAAAYWFTASTSFANPAVTLARAATDTFAGIRPADVPAFLAAQVVGAALATALFAWLDSERGESVDLA